MEKLNDVIIKALEEVRPTSEEIERADSVARLMLKSLETAFAGDALKVTVEGSYAKGTFVRGRVEVDLFIHYSPKTPREEMTRKTLEKSREIIVGHGGTTRLRYAEHPYLEGFLNNVRINVVPCYQVEGGRWLSAVDRTPYHTQYVRANLRREQVGDVQLLKALLMASNLYGAEIRVGGFSGYVCELLIISYGSFTNLLKEASSWRIPVRIGPSLDQLSLRYPNAPMILADPVDPTRNAAAAVSLESLSQFILLSRLFISKPSLEYFHQAPAAELSQQDRSILAVILENLDEKPPDIIWGEVRRTAEGIVRSLEHHDFNPLRWAGNVDNGRCAILVELGEKTLPPYSLHMGPPVTHPSAEDFINKQLTGQKLAAGPWIRGNRLYALRKRAYRTASELIGEKLRSGEIAVSKGLAKALSNSKILENPDEISAEMEAIGFTTFLKEFVEACPNFIRVYRSLQ